MEPFFLRCETCQARLRVRDERFLGQIQSCPKCGSMVQILAPAGWLTPGETTIETPPELSEVAAASSPSVAANAIDWVRSHAIASTVAATGVIAACGLAAFLALRGDEQLASLPSPPSAVEVAADEAAKPVEEPVEQIGTRSEAADLAAAAETENEVAQEEAVAATESPPASPQEIEQPVEVASSSSSFLPLITPPAIEVPAPPSEESRKLTLEPVEQEVKPATATATATQPTVAAYPPEVETEAAEIEAGNIANAKPPADDSNLPSLDPPARRTNVMDQLSVPIDSITLPDVPIGEFVGFVSTMTAVPIELDPKVLGEVGLSSRSTVTVHGEATTAGKLLARVLKEHQLTCIERDGTLVVVRAKR